MAEEEKDLGFKIEDKRRFDATGRAREIEDESAVEDAAEAAPEHSPGASGEATDTPPDQGMHAQEDYDERGDGGERVPGELTFSSFVIGLASQAFMFLGSAPDPNSGVVHKDLGQAKAMIDILSMLHTKTTGNLSEDEAHMMDELLYELRMQYVKEMRETVRPQGGHE